jgi:hypothetical protein
MVALQISELKLQSISQFMIPKIFTFCYGNGNNAMTAKNILDLMSIATTKPT